MPSDGGMCRACGRSRHSGECWPFVPASDIHAATVANLNEQIDRLIRERDSARTAQIVRFKVEPWGDGEMVITANGEPMGATISRSEANAACRWVASAWADLIKANNTPTTGGQGEVVPSPTPK